MQKIMFNDKFCLTQAVLEGRKTMTRRIIQAPKTWHGFEVYGFCINKNYLGNVKDISLVDADGGIIEDENGSLGMILPKYNIGEVVAVAQSYKDAGLSEDTLIYHADKDHGGYRIVKAVNEKGWSNKMFVAANLMPHHIRITDIKVERLQDISDEDCLKEGIYSDMFDDSGILSQGYVMAKDDGRLHPISYYEVFDSPREAFAALIDKVSGKGTWEKNPWVFAYSFELID